MKQGVLPVCCPHCGKIITDPPPAPREATKRLNNWRALFHHFWGPYPHKVAKGEAMEAWDRLAPPPSSPGLEQRLKWILGKLEGYLRHEWEGQERRKIPYPATFLNRLAKDLKHGEE